MLEPFQLQCFQLFAGHRFNFFLKKHDKSFLSLFVFFCITRENIINSFAVALRRQKAYQRYYY